MAKTTFLLDDLRPTMRDLLSQIEELSSRREELKASAARLDADISVTRGRLAPLREDMDQHLEVRSAIERDLDLHQRIEELEERRSQLDGEAATPAHRPTDYIPNRALSAFDQVLQHTLEAWKVPSVEYAEYDQYQMEISCTPHSPRPWPTTAVSTTGRTPGSSSSTRPSSPTAAPTATPKATLQVTTYR
jgi:hypothetical protein